MAGAGAEFPRRFLAASRPVAPVWSGCAAIGEAVGFRANAHACWAVSVIDCFVAWSICRLSETIDLTLGCCRATVLVRRRSMTRLRPTPRRRLQAGPA